MWNFENLTHQLGDAFEKVRKEVESLAQYDEETEREVATQETVAG